MLKTGADLPSGTRARREALQTIGVRSSMGAMQVPEAALERLHAAGLVVGHPFPANHVAWPDGRTIAKPDNVPGNSVPGWCARWGLGPTICDGPSVHLCWRGGKWVVEVSEMEPGPGPGDFTREFETLDEAISDILDYFFGDPVRMDLFNKRKRPYE